MAQVTINNIQAVDMTEDGKTSPQAVTAGHEQIFVGFGSFSGGTLSVEHQSVGSSTWSAVAVLTADGMNRFTSSTGLYRLRLSGSTTPVVSGFLAQVHGVRV